MIKLLPLLILWSASIFAAETIPQERLVDWTLAGVRDSSTTKLKVIDMQREGLFYDGITPNDAIIEQLLLENPDGAILQFPQGEFLFNKTIKLRSNIIIRGEGPNNTTFAMDLGGTGQAILISGTASTTKIPLSANALKDANTITISTASNLSVGDWLQIKENDTHLITSDWALGSVGQIAQIKSISGQIIELNSPLRMTFEMIYAPYITKITPISNVGIECLKIKRIDDTTPEHASNINITNAVNCWINTIESENCGYSHIQAVASSNISIADCYLQQAFNYGDGGTGYGVMLHYTTNECRVENNIFNHLRHSMIVQAGANGNVFAYNYSVNPYWDTYPFDASGDMVLHGNYPFANLFEQNICQNIIIDNSHGSNGPLNTFFRNRAESFGIFISDTNSPRQSLIGNEITNNTFPYNMVNFTIQGDDHLLWGNNNKGIISPENTEALTEISYAYTTKPDYIPTTQWGKIGTPNKVSSASIPAKERYFSGNKFCDCCNRKSVGMQDFITNGTTFIFPNPATDKITILCEKIIASIQITNQVGKRVTIAAKDAEQKQIDCTTWQPGIYQINIRFSDENTFTTKAIKVN